MKGRSKLERYSLAMICCGVALAVAWPIDAPSSCFLLAVTVSGLFGGLGPSLLSVAFSSIAFEYFFLRRTFSIAKLASQLPISDFQSCWLQHC